jgi:nitroimidazol reductase NimA-like FMN-containing flavoprotein (pyridoxamine 5'-phosphate oxidase superfamily)
VRRKEREITEINEKLALLKICKVCRLGLSVRDEPYVIPLNFGYTWTDNKLTLYFHSSTEGKKIEMLHANSKACFEIDTDHELVQADTACGYTFRYASLIGFGTIAFINTKEEKLHALNALMRHQTDEDKIFTFTDDEIEKVLVYKLLVSEFTGKKY